MRGVARAPPRTRFSPPILRQIRTPTHQHFAYPNGTQPTFAFDDERSVYLCCEAMRKQFSLGAVAGLLISASLLAQTSKPNLTLDEFFNSVGFTAVKVSPDGNAVVVATERADWEQQIFRKELWFYRIAGNGGSLVQLTQSGRDGAPQWS